MFLSKLYRLTDDEEITSSLRSPSHEEVATLSKLQISIFAILLIISVALALKNYDSFQLGSYQDDASYAVLAKSIVSTDTYGLMNVPGQPLPTRYPFGFPLLLSPLAWLFPTALDTMKLVSLLATLLNSFLLFWGWPYLSQNRSYWWGLVIAALYSVSPLVTGHTRMVMSEPAFTTFVLVSLILTEKYLTDGKEHLLSSLAVGVVIFFTLFIRTIGIVLVVAVFCRILILPLDRVLKGMRLIYLLISGIALTITVITITPIKIYNLLPIEYTHQFEHPHSWGQSQVEEALVPRLFGAFLEYTRQHLRGAVIPIGGGTKELEFGLRFGISDLPLSTGLIIGCVILLGTLSVLQKQGLQPTVFIFEMLYFGAILLWPWRAPRFLYPILPFLFYHLLCGVRFVANQLWRAKLIIPSGITPFIVKLSTTVVILFILFFSIYKGVSDSSKSIQFVPNLRVGASWLKENSPVESIIMAQQPQGVYIYAERHTIDYPSGEEFSSSDQFQNILQNQGVNYVIVAPEMKWRQDGMLDYDKFTSEKVMPILNKLAEHQVIEMVYQSEPDLVKVYQVKHK